MSKVTKKVPGDSNKKRGKYNSAKYTQDALDEAVAQVQSHALSINKACSQYGIPKGTLVNKLHSHSSSIKKRGPSTVLTTDEELRIKQWIIDKASIGYAMHPSVLKQAIKSVLDKAPRDNPFKDNLPGSKWFKLFLKRHPEIGLKHTQILSKSRASVTEQNIRQWFADLKDYLTKQNAVDILEDPTRIFNLDETGVQLCPRSGKLLGLKKEKNMYYISPGQEKETITVLGCYGADGREVAPMIVYPYKRFPPKDVANSVPDNFVIGHTPTGWMNIQTYNSFIMNGFYKTLAERGVKFPVVLLFDGHSSHISLELHDFCNEKQIILYLLYPNATHIIQPCDVGIFRPLKIQWKKEVALHSQKSTKAITKLNFAPIFSEAHKKACTPEVVKKAFESCGLYPFNPDKINYTKCMSTRHQNINKNKLSDDAEPNIKYGDYDRTNDILLNDLEMNIPRDILKQFHVAYLNDTCPTNEQILFNLWKKYKGSSSTSNNHISCDSSVYSSTDSDREMILASNDSSNLDVAINQSCDINVPVEIDLSLEQSIDLIDTPIVIIQRNSEDLIHRELNNNKPEAAILYHQSDVTLDTIDMGNIEDDFLELKSISVLEDISLNSPPHAINQNLQEPEPNSSFTEIGSNSPSTAVILMTENVTPSSSSTKMASNSPSTTVILMTENVTPSSSSTKMASNSPSTTVNLMTENLTPSSSSTEMASNSPSTAVNLMTENLTSSSSSTEMASNSPSTAVNLMPENLTSSSSSTEMASNSPSTAVNLMTENLTPSSSSTEMASNSPSTTVNLMPENLTPTSSITEIASTTENLIPLDLSLNSSSTEIETSDTTNLSGNFKPTNLLWKEALHFPEIIKNKKASQNKKPTIFAIHSKEWKEQEVERKRKADELQQQKEIRKFEREVKKKIKLEEDEKKKKERKIKKELQLKKKLETEKRKEERRLKKKEQLHVVANDILCDITNK